VDRNRATEVFAHWSKRWRDTPLFNQLLGPVIWFGLLGLLSLVVLMGATVEREFPLMLLALPAGLTAVWVVSLAMTIHKVQHAAAFTLIALSHLLLFTYPIGILLMMGGIVTILAGLAPVAILMIGLGGVLTVFGLATLVVSRRCEKHLAAECLRNALREEVAISTEGGS